jgi:GTP cyclohydrolase I
MSERVYFSIDRCHGSYQLSINIEDDDGGGGHGYRIAGPKYDGTSGRLLKHYVTERDRSELHAYIDPIVEASEMSFTDAVRIMIKETGEDPDREGLQETPGRVLAAWSEWFGGYGKDPAAILKTFEETDCDEMVVQLSIPFFSHCEHHLVPFFGFAHLAYIPNGRVVGLSKLGRLVDIFARRLQIQERLCNQVADALYDNLNPKGVGVVMQARHLCLESRGLAKTGSVTVTSALRGNFKANPEVRAEFLSLVKTGMTGVIKL